MIETFFAKNFAGAIYTEKKVTFVLAFVRVIG
jgi:hypothetical protein